MEKSYVDGKPKWISKPEDSAFCVLSKAEMDAKTAEEIQAILKRQHICITDQFRPVLQFDAAGLATLGRLDKPVTVQGMAVILSFHSRSPSHYSRLLKAQ